MLSFFCQKILNVILSSMCHTLFKCRAVLLLSHVISMSCCLVCVISYINDVLSFFCQKLYQVVLFCFCDRLSFFYFINVCLALFPFYAKSSPSHVVNDAVCNLCHVINLSGFFILLLSTFSGPNQEF